MSQQFYYPNPSLTLSGSANGAPIPSSSIVVGGENPSGNVQPLQTDASGNLKVDVAGFEPGSTIDTNLIQVAGAAISLGQKTMALSLPIVIASDQSTLPISAAALPLPSGASTSALQTQISGQLPTTLGAHVVAASLSVNVASDQVVPVSATALPLPTGAATEATLAAVSGKLPATLGQKAMAASMAVAIASDQSTLPVSLASSPLPTGAATAALQTSGNASLTSIDGKLGSLGQKTSAGSAPVVIASDQSTLPVSAASLPLPTGAATETTLAAMSAKLPATLGQKASAASMAVVLASDQSIVPISVGGTAIANAPIFNDYTSVNITTGAYVQLVASTSNAINNIHIFDSSGQAMILAVGAAASEVIQLYVPPGGDSYTLNIPAGSRIAYKALIATASSGYLLMSFLK